MIFKNTNNLISEIQKCCYCNNDLITSIGVIFRQPLYNTNLSTFDNTFFNVIKPSNTYSSEGHYVSTEYDDKLNLSFKFQGSVHNILDLNKENNLFNGDLDKIQRLMWNQKLIISRCCYSDSHHYAYLSISFRKKKQKNY